MAREYTARTAFPTVVTSEVAYYESGKTVISAKVIAEFTGDVIFYLSADDGSTWESVTNKILHAFTTTGTKLKWKAVGKYPAQLTYLKVEYVTQ